MSSIIILADDLTGANDSAVHFAKNGFSTMVKVLNDGVGDILTNNNNEVIAINTDTRSVSSQDAYTNIFEVTSLLQKTFTGLLYKKIDSILRGNPASELEAVMDAMNYDLAFVAPSFPDNNRMVNQGVLTAPNLEIDTVKMFSQVMHKKIVNIPLHIIRAGAKQIDNFIKYSSSGGSMVYILDACTNDDLKIIKDAANLIKQPKILCGSAGLAIQLSEGNVHSQDKKHYSPKNGKKGSLILVAIGSYKKETAQQLKKLSDYCNSPIIVLETNFIIAGKGEDVIKNCLEAIALQTDGGSKILLLSTDTLNKNTKVNCDNLVVVEIIGEITRRIYQAYDIHAIVSAGGDTSLKICQALKTSYIKPIEEIQPGIPVGVMLNGLADSTLIVTKSGGFGDENALIYIIDYLKKDRKL